MRIELADAEALRTALVSAKASSRRTCGNELAQYLPQRLAQTWLRLAGIDSATPICELRDRDIGRLAEDLSRWEPIPCGSEGWRKAEVTAGGVDTRELSSRTMENPPCAGPVLHWRGG